MPTSLECVVLEMRLEKGGVVIYARRFEFIPSLHILILEFG